MAQRFRDYTMNLAAGVESAVTVEGDYFQVLACTNPVQIRFDDDGVAITRAQGQGGPAKYRRIVFISQTAQAITVGLGIVGDKPPYDTRFTVGGSITVNAATIIPDVNDQTLSLSVPANTGTMLIAADATRRGVWVGLASTVLGGVYVQGNSVTPTTAKGLFIEPGDKIFIEGTDALGVFNPPGQGAIVVNLFVQRFV